MARRFIFDPPDRFVAGTVGAPGSRTFYLQARSGERIVSVSLEKVQVAVLAERLGALLDELERRGLVPGSTASGDDEPLDEPINELFRATALTLAWDGDAERVVIEARETAPPGATADEDDEDDEDEDEDDDTPEIVIETETEESEVSLTGAFERLGGGLEAVPDEDESDVVSVRLEAGDARAFVARAARVLASGRPPCPFCGEPLDPQGHLCPRRNGNLLN